jgi:hypothetical protein
MVAEVGLMVVANPGKLNINRQANRRAQGRTLRDIRLQKATKKLGDLGKYAVP